MIKTLTNYRIMKNLLLLNLIFLLLSLCIVNISFAEQEEAEDYEVFKVYPSDRLARLIVESPFIYSGNASQVLRTWTQTVYEKAKDEFDFIIFVQNCNSCISDFSGIFIITSNQVEGIGLSVFNNNIGWGADTKLQGVLYLTNIRNLRSGPSLHELLHNWANYVIPPNVPNIGSHWGIAGTPGQLGGFDPESLIYLGDNQYQATNGKPGSTSFGVNANGGNSLPYSAIELYLMGLVPAYEVPPVPVAVNPQAVDFANGIFSADSFVETTIDDLIISFGSRVPAYGAAQNRFRILTILVFSSEPTDEEWRRVDSDLELFAREGSDDDELLFNFFEATGGRGALEVNGLSKAVDTDGDGFSDADELAAGTDPNDPKSHPSKAMPWIPLLLLDE